MRVALCRTPHRLFRLLVATIVVSTALIQPASTQAAPPASDDACLVQARAILRAVPLIDGHNDAAEYVLYFLKNRMRNFDFRDTTRLQPPMHTDLQRLRQGGLGGLFWSLYVSPRLPGAEAVQAVLAQADVVHRIVERHPRDLELATSEADVWRIHRSGRIACLMGLEGGHSIHDSLAVLRQFHRMGARYMTLTHWWNNNWAEAATDRPKKSGLTAFGREVVREMNRLGMLVDLSHVSERAMVETLEVTRAPVLFSHSGARVVCGHPRNVSDDVLRRVRANGGVVMVYFASDFVSEEVRLWEAEYEAQKARIENLWIGRPDRIEAEMKAWVKAHPKPVVPLGKVADHIDHIRRVAGIEHVGLGSDYDGIEALPEGLGDVSRYPHLLAELLRRGYSRKDVEMVAGRNVLRVLRQAEQVAARLQKVERPSDATFEELDGPRAAAPPR